MAPGTFRSIVGIVLLVIGGVTLLALFLGGQGLFGQFVTDVLRPLLRPGCLAAGRAAHRRGRDRRAVRDGPQRLGRHGRGRPPRLPGGGGPHPPHLRAQGRRRGPERRWWLHRGVAGQSTLTDLVGPAGAFVVLVGIVIVGILLMFGLTLRALLQPVSSGGRVLGRARPPPRSAATVNAARTLAPGGADDQATAVASRRGVDHRPRPRQARRRASVPASSPAPSAVPASLPAPTPSPAPLSQTVWAGGAPEATARAPPARPQAPRPR